MKIEEWIPAFTGDKPPYWVDGMDWAVAPEIPDTRDNDPSWIMSSRYNVPAEAVHGQGGDAVVERDLDALIEELHKHPTEELAKRGVMLVEVAKDPARELWADLLSLQGENALAYNVRYGAEFERPFDGVCVDLIRSYLEKPEQSND